MNKNENKNIENVKGIFKKMIADKKAIKSYIREHKTLDGFNNESIKFAKPLRNI